MNTAELIKGSDGSVQRINLHVGGQVLTVDLFDGELFISNDTWGGLLQLTTSAGNTLRVRPIVMRNGMITRNPPKVV